MTGNVFILNLEKTFKKLYIYETLVYKTLDTICNKESDPLKRGNEQEMNPGKRDRFGVKETQLKCQEDHVSQDARDLCTGQNTLVKERTAQRKRESTSACSRDLQGEFPWSTQQSTDKSMSVRTARTVRGNSAWHTHRPRISACSCQPHQKT